MTSPLRVLETCLYAEDLTAAERFYVDVLGLKVHGRLEGRHVFFVCGASMFLVFHPGATASGSGGMPGHGAHGPGHVAFAVAEEDLDRWASHLAEQSVPIEAQVRWPGGGRSIYFRDPAGNSLELATPRTWGF